MSGGWAGPPSPAPQWVQRGAAPGRGGRSLPAELRLGGGGGAQREGGEGAPLSLPHPQGGPCRSCSRRAGRHMALLWVFSLPASDIQGPTFIF